MAEDEEPYGTPTDELVAERIAEHVAAAIAAEPDEERRQRLQESAEEGDFSVQPTGDPAMLLITVGDDDVGEVSKISLRRPDDASTN